MGRIRIYVITAGAAVLCRFQMMPTAYCFAQVPCIAHGGELKHLHNAERRFDCPQTFLSSNFQCRDDVPELMKTFQG